MTFVRPPSVRGSRLCLAALSALALACGTDGRDNSGSGIGLDPTLGSGGVDGDASTGTSTGAADEGGGDEASPATDTANADGSSGADGMLPKFDIGYNPGGEVDCMANPAMDEDGDGWTGNQGDCNDCDADVNPGAIEVVVTTPDDTGQIPAPADENCDGLVDNLMPSCDGGLALDDDDPLSAAAALGICKMSSGPGDWGIVDAKYVRANGAAVAGADLQYGLETEWGTNVDPQEGASMLVLSSGHARYAGQAGECGALTCYGSGAGTAPAGFPQDVPACAGSTNINDDIALELTLRAPTNATGYAYNFDFYSFEYPEWVCTSFNDQYIALVDPAPMGSINGNISFDSMSNPVSVNIAFFDVCSGCALGTSELAGTGFDTWDDAGATSWLVTTAPVDGGDEFTIRFAIWDTGDSAWDSTVLLDNFRWLAGGGEVDVGTEPEG